MWGCSHVPGAEDYPAAARAESCSIRAALGTGTAASRPGETREPSRSKTGGAGDQAGGRVTCNRSGASWDSRKQVWPQPQRISSVGVWSLFMCSGPCKLQVPTEMLSFKATGKIKLGKVNLLATEN